MKTKKGDEIVTEQIIFIILNLVFFLSLIFFVIRAGGSDSVLEEVHAKKLALIIDSMQPGMEVSIYAPDLFDQIQKNKFKDVPIIIEGNSIKVIVRKNGGYSFKFFSDIGINQQSMGWDTNTKTIIIKT